MSITLVDSGALIALLDDTDVHHAASSSAIVTSLREGNSLAIAATTLAEILVRPYSVGDQAVSRCLNAIDRLPISVIDLDRAIAIKAAEMRATIPSLRLPDATILATAVMSSAASLLTTDAKLASASASLVRTIHVRE
jgi:predicted nucleic acid-binding protein